MSIDQLKLDIHDLEQAQKKCHALSWIDGNDIAACVGRLLAIELTRMRHALRALEGSAPLVRSCPACKAHPGMVPTKQAVQGWEPCPTCSVLGPNSAERERLMMADDPDRATSVAALLAPITQEELNEANKAYGRTSPTKLKPSDHLTDLSDAINRVFAMRREVFTTKEAKR